MKTILQWLKVHSPTAQSVSAAWLFLSVLWATNTQFHDYITGAFDALPKGVHAFVVGIIIPVCVLWRTQRKNVAVAEAAPGQTGTAVAKATTLGALALVLLCGSTMRAQGVANLYAVGPSYNPSAAANSQHVTQVAGTALYAHALTDASSATGTYAFTVFDAVPTGTKPFTVTSNVGVGVAEKVATINGVAIYVPVGAGFSWAGANAGWQWSGGAAAPITVGKTKDGGSWFLVPTVRFLKSSVSNGEGYQVIAGLHFGWGK